MSYYLKTNKPQAFKEYHDQTKGNDKAKIDWLMRFTLNPSEGGCIAESSTSVKRQRRDGVEDAWLTEAELAGPLWLNSAARAAAIVKELEGRPHSRSKALRDLGVLEYHVFRDA
eukprot:2388497-Pyramimonas_sp.AAC.1